VRKALVLVSLVALTTLVGCGRSSGSTGTAASGQTQTSTAASGTSVTRITGSDPYVLAAEIAKKWPSASDVVIARADDPADALAGSYAAGTHVSPILYAEHDHVPQATIDTLQRLGAYHVRLLGGEAALGKGVEDDLKAAGMKQIDRVAGADRYETAKLIAENVPASNVGVRADFGSTVMLANGLRPADALAAGPLSYGRQWPILLTATDALPAPTQWALDDLHTAHVIVVGGTAVVSDAVVKQLEASGRSVERIAGPDRTATATALADLMIAVGLQVNRVEVAGANAVMTALVLGPHAAPDAPVLLCATVDDCGASTMAWIAAHKDAITSVVIGGGTDEVSQVAEKQLADAS
jgi:putative cell wall-binding protein